MPAWRRQAASRDHVFGQAANESVQIPPLKPTQSYCSKEECLNNCRENSFAFVGLILVPDTLAKLVGRCSNPCLASKPGLDRRTPCRDLTVWHQSTNCVASTDRRFSTLTSRVTVSKSELSNLKKIIKSLLVVSRKGPLSC